MSVRRTGDLFDADVEISDDAYIIKADEAKKLKDPPKLVELSIQPDHVVLKIGEQASFYCAGKDQYGQTITVNDIEWSALGGSIESNGLYTADGQSGAYNVKAMLDGNEAHAEVRISAKDEDQETIPKPGYQYLRWRGVVPAQKWMNFYTKVLSKYATSAELKLEVSFEVKVDGDQGAAKTTETKSALRELGLDENVSTGP